MKSFFLSKTIEVTKEEFIAHLQTQIEYWERIKQREMEKHPEQVSRLKNKQQKQLLEYEKILMDKKKQIKAVSEN